MRTHDELTNDQLDALSGGTVQATPTPATGSQPTRNVILCGDDGSELLRYVAADRIFTCNYYPSGN